MLEIASSLDGQSSDIHLITDQAMLKVESVQKMINEQFHEFSASVAQSVTQLKDASDQFITQSQTLQNESGKVTENIQKAGELAQEHSRELNESSQKIVRETETLTASVQREAEALLSHASGALNELRKAGDMFAIRAGEVAEQMKSSLQISEQYGRELKSQASGISDVTAKTTEQLEKATLALNGKISDIGRTAREAGEKVETIREKLSTETERLLHVSSAALEAAQDASSTFSKQSESLFKASQDASQFVRDLQSGEVRAQREAFLSSAKFIVESLHSLSMDLTRMLDGEIQEKTWKAFKKGDISAFTRRLVELGDALPIERARQKFEKDTEFRTYVLRYTRQFEEMFEQAMDSDHGALLSSTIASSDVAKLYTALCQVKGF
jgi:ABC-type transporter Mla subunit MlaD